MKHPLIHLRDDYKSGIKRGIYSVCSANEFVIAAAMHSAVKTGEYVLIEATANQVNQFGGYTGMLPSDFSRLVFDIAEIEHFDKSKILLGGDHLGPLIWKEEPSETAMEKAEELIRQYVSAGFTKIHIDTSMGLKDDKKGEKLSSRIIAKRGARLAKASEEAFEVLKKHNSSAIRPIYIIGSEVPVPGGTQMEEEGLQITKVSDFIDTVNVFKEEFLSKGLVQAWDNVIGVVVQPGVEFSDENVHEYRREAAKELTTALNDYPSLIFEGHSTDYQSRYKLREMVQDGIAILKVGPALTFALREALFALCFIEKEMLADTGVYLSNFINILDNEMLKNPSNWQNYYHASQDKLKLKRRYSLSDRARYYLSVREIDKSIKRLISNLDRERIPLTLLSQYMPIQYKKVRDGEIGNNPKSLIQSKICECIEDYSFAVLMDNNIARFF